jgi:hypothetical protein
MSRTVTEKMAKANRQNAQKSTGPKTEEGKANSSQNAVRHGLLSEKILLRNFPLETNKEFQDIREEMFDAHQPQNAAEVMLVQRIVVCHWRLLRAFRYETYCLHTNRLDASPEANAAEFILPNDQQIDRILRYEAQIDRQLHRNIKQLLAVQADRRARAQQRAAAEEADNEAAVMQRLLPDPITFLSKVGLLKPGAIEQAARECEERRASLYRNAERSEPNDNQKPPDPGN